MNAPRGCHFRPRCPHEFAKCTEVPPLAAHLSGEPDHRDRCWLEAAEKRRLRRIGDGIGLQSGGETVIA
jgi:hypothetical protein